jgi:hypothetical protein
MTGNKMSSELLTSCIVNHIEVLFQGATKPYGVYGDMMDDPLPDAGQRLNIKPGSNGVNQSSLTIDPFALN